MSNCVYYKYFPNPAFIITQKGASTYAKTHTEAPGFSINTFSAMVIHLRD